MNNNSSLNNLIHQVFLAYYDARNNKRNTHNQLNFEIDYEPKLIDLAHRIYNKEYKLLPSVVFMVNKPVQREIFAADFSDRVVHHLIYRAIYTDIEKHFIFDSYSCRKNKGNLFGIKRAKKFIRSASNNYQRDAFILKLDIRGYFMHIKHDIIYHKMIKMLDKKRLIRVFHLRF
jgi:hypothetical protein